MNAPRPDFFTLDTYQTPTAATPARHLTRARTLRSLVPGLHREEVHHACTIIRIPALIGPDVIEYRHELQVAPNVHAYLYRAQRAPLKPEVRRM